MFQRSNILYDLTGNNTNVLAGRSKRSDGSSQVSSSDLYYGGTRADTYNTSNPSAISDAKKKKKPSSSSRGNEVIQTTELVRGKYHALYTLDDEDVAANRHEHRSSGRHDSSLDDEQKINQLASIVDSRINTYNTIDIPYNLSVSESAYSRGYSKYMDTFASGLDGPIQRAKDVEPSQTRKYTPSSIIQVIIQSNAQNERQELLLTCMSLLRQRIRTAIDIGVPMTIDDVSQTYSVYAVSKHRYAVPTFNYYQHLMPTSTVGFGREITFQLTNTEQFINDIVLYVEIDGIGNPSLLYQPALSLCTPQGQATVPYFHYCDFPGVRLCKRSRFEIDGINYEEYYPHNVMMSREFDITNDHKQAWDIAHGQEQPTDGYIYLPDSQIKVKQQIYNGAQTPRVYQKPLQLWIKGNFFFNDPETPLPTGQIYCKSRTISYILEDLSKILFVKIGGTSYGYGTPECLLAAAQYGITLPPAPTITKAHLYVNNISMDPYIYDIYIKSISTVIVRTHYSAKYQLALGSGTQRLDLLKYAIESLRFGLQPPVNSTSPDSWYKYDVLVPRTNVAPILLVDTNGSSILPLHDTYGNIRYNETLPVVKNVGFYINGDDNRLYDLSSPTFYSAYLQTRPKMLYAPTDPGLMAITFNRGRIDENTLETTGYLDLTRMKEFTFAWNSDYITQSTPADLFICTKCMNILNVSEHGEYGYQLSFYM
jgi:hypothetical protein